MQNFERKLMKFWIQSFLLGVPKIIVGYRDQGGILRKIEEIQTESIPAKTMQRGVQSWNADMCINFASNFLDCKSPAMEVISCYYEPVLNTNDRAETSHQRRRRMACSQSAWIQAN